MKKIISILYFIICINTQSNAQQNNQLIAANTLSVSKPVPFLITDPSNPDIKDYDYYMRQSKRSRNTGLILLGGGVLISGIGALLLFGDNDTYYQSRGETGATMLITGAAAGIASIPFMAIALGRSNKAKATISTQKMGFGVPSHVSKDIIGVTMVLPIGK